MRAEYAKYDHPADSPASMFSLKATDLEVYGENELYVTGMLQKYGGKASLVEMPEIIDRHFKVYDEENPVFYTAEDYRNEGVRVLDYKKPLTVRLHKKLDLSGIGVVDGKLHVQLHLAEDAFRSYPSTLNSIRGAEVYLTNNGEYVDNSSWLSSVSWSIDDDDMPDFVEFIFPWDFREGDHPAIKVKITDISEIIEATWKIDVPLESVWTGDPAYLENK